MEEVWENEAIAVNARARRARQHPPRPETIDIEIHIDPVRGHSATLTVGTSALIEALGLRDLSPNGFAAYCRQQRLQMSITQWDRHEYSGLVTPVGATFLFHVDQQNPVGFMWNGSNYTYPEEQESRIARMVQDMGAPLRAANAEEISFVAAFMPFDKIVEAILERMRHDEIHPDYPPYYSLQNNEGFIKEFFLSEHYEMKYENAIVSLIHGDENHLFDGIAANIILAPDDTGRVAVTIQMSTHVIEHAIDNMMQVTQEEDFVTTPTSLWFKTSRFGQFCDINIVWVSSMMTGVGGEYLELNGYTTKESVLSRFLNSEFSVEQWEEHKAYAISRVQHPDRDDPMKMVPIIRGLHDVFQSRVTIQHTDHDNDLEELPIINGAFIQVTGYHLVLVIYDREYFGSWLRFWNDTRVHPHYKITGWSHTLGRIIPGITHNRDFHRYGTCELLEVENLTDDEGIDIDAVKLQFEMSGDPP